MAASAETERRRRSSASGSWAGPMAAQPARRRASSCRSTRARARRRSASRPSTARARRPRPREAAEGADASITMVPDAPRGRGGAARRRTAPPRRCGDGALAIDMSTIAPTAARAIGERLADDGDRLPRGAGVRLAAEGRGRHAHDHGRRPSEDFERARPLFDAMGELIVHVGPQGHGQLAKLLTNTMGAVNAVALAEASRWRRAAGLDPDALPRGGRRQRGQLDDAQAEGAPDVRPRLRRRSSSSSTCSRTCATASTRRARARRPRSWLGRRRRALVCSRRPPETGSAETTISRL